MEVEIMLAATNLGLRVRAMVIKRISRAFLTAWEGRRGTARRDGAVQRGGQEILVRESRKGLGSLYFLVRISSPGDMVPAKTRRTVESARRRALCQPGIRARSAGVLHRP